MTKKYEHLCPEWDYLKIDENDPEICCCICFNSDEFKAIREQWLEKSNFATDLVEIEILPGSIQELIDDPR